jgi:D-glycero-D-manno-heptose 1,7-bisphosphate phosphatase
VEHKKKIAFFDRDGVINKKANDHHYISSVEDVVFTEGIFHVCGELKEQGFEFIVLTNQRGVARGLYTVADVEKVHSFIQAIFKEHALSLLAFYYCPHDHGQCTCRKPQDGMLRQAVHDFDINLKESLLISDSPDDISMAKDFGIGKHILIPSDDILSARPKLYI